MHCVIFSIMLVLCRGGLLDSITLIDTYGSELTHYYQWINWLIFSWQHRCCPVYVRIPLPCSSWLLLFDSSFFLLSLPCAVCGLVLPQLSATFCINDWSGGWVVGVFETNYLLPCRSNTMLILFWHYCFHSTHWSRLTHSLIHSLLMRQCYWFWPFYSICSCPFDTITGWSNTTCFPVIKQASSFFSWLITDRRLYVYY